jgi:hypothetical protein
MPAEDVPDVPIPEAEPEEALVVGFAELLP